VLFVERGGVVIADREPGPFDGHGRRLPKPALSDVFVGPASRSAASFVFGNGKARFTSPLPMAMTSRTPAADANSRDRRREAALPCPAADGSPASDVEIRDFGNGEMTIVGLQRDYLPPSSPDSREIVVLALPGMFSVYDLRTGQALGNTDPPALDPGSVEPTLLTLPQKPIAPASIAGPNRVHLGEMAEFHIRSNSPAAHGVIHLKVIDPSGSLVGHYSANLLTARPRTTYALPPALNDQTAAWKVRATDLPSGWTATAALRVEP
jgi:hypothetical protein